ncbi:AAA family ATPase [Catenuloplanes japonicus]|uniref:AAA family ATPase n=1 Tax=Catenuloplanes japonicus TaxID=33876 RepID=UPI00068F037C|nr:AAA family ATPase [Catenuloplanes japonicus]
MTSAMISEVYVGGLTSFRDMEIDLGPLTVLVGANGSGKSNFVRALELLGRIVDGDLQLFVELSGGASALLRQPNARGEMQLAVRTASSEYAVTLSQTSDDRLIFLTDQVSRADGPFRRTDSRSGLRESDLFGEADSADETAEIRSPLSGCRVFHFSDTGTTAPVKAAGPTADNLSLRPDARNLAAILLGLRDSDEHAYRRIVAAVQMVAPYFRDFVLVPEGRDQIRLRWRQVGTDTVFSAYQMSDGTLRFICLATLLLQPKPPRMLVLDEPELGLHPFAIVQVADMIRAASVNSQVVVATQSVTLVDQMSLEDIVVVDRDNGASVLTRPDPERLSAWLEDYSLGELWQKNLIGGRPHREAA